MRSPAINACGSTRRRAAPPDPIDPRVPVVEDLDERRLVELSDHGGIHRGGRFPGREPYARFHVSVDPNIRPVFHPDGETMSERPAHGSFANSGKNGSRVRSHVALTPPNPNTVVDPWWSDTTSPLAWSLAQYAGSNAAGIVPSLQPASVEGGGMPATALAARRTPQRPRAKVRFPPRRPARSKSRKNPIPAKIARGIIRYSACR